MKISPIVLVDTSFIFSLLKGFAWFVHLLQNESAAASCPGLTETLLAEHHHPPAASGYQQQMPCGRQQVARVKPEPLGLWDKLLKPEPPSNVCITPASASSLEGSYTASLPRDDDSPASASSESDASLHCTSLGDVMELLRPPSCVRPLPPSSGQLLSSPMLLDTLDMYLTKKEDSILSYTMEALAVLSGGASLDDNARRKLASFICCAEIHELLRHIIAGVLWRVMALDADSVSTLDWWLEAFEEFFRSPEQALASEACQEVLELTVLALEYHAQATPYKTRHPFCPLTFGNRVARVVECLVKRSRWPIEKLLMRLLDLAVDQYGAYSNRNTQQCLHHVAYLVVDFCRPLTSQARLNLVARLPSRLALRVARLLLEKDPCSLSSTDPVFRLLENYCKVFSPSLCTKDEPIEGEIVGLVVIVLQQLLQAGLMLTDNVVWWLNQLAVVCPDYKVELSVLVSTHSWLREPP